MFLPETGIVVTAHAREQYHKRFGERISSDRIRRILRTQAKRLPRRMHRRLLQFSLNARRARNVTSYYLHGLAVFVCRWPKAGTAVVVTVLTCEQITRKRKEDS